MEKKTTKLLKQLKFYKKKKENIIRLHLEGFFYKVDNFFISQNKNKISKICNQKINNYKNLNL